MVYTVEKLERQAVRDLVGDGKHTIRVSVYGRVYLSIRAWGRNREVYSVRRGGSKIYDGHDIDAAYDAAVKHLDEMPSLQKPFLNIASWDGKGRARVRMRPNGDGTFTLDVESIEGNIVLNYKEHLQEREVIDG